MRRANRIRRICELKRLRESEAVGRMKSARQKLLEARRLLAELERHRAAYFARLEEGAVSGLSVPNWRAQRQFLGALEQALRQQCAQIENEHKAVGVSEDQWRRKHVEAVAAETFLERVARREERGAERRRLGREEDLIAARRHYAQAEGGES